MRQQRSYRAARLASDTNQEKKSVCTFDEYGSAGTPDWMIPWSLLPHVFWACVPFLAVGAYWFFTRQQLHKTMPTYKHVLVQCTYNYERVRQQGAAHEL